MRWYHWNNPVFLATLFVIAPAPSSAEVITYRVEGVVTEESSFASAGSNVVGYFSYKDDLPIYLSQPGWVSYGYPSNIFPDPHPSDVYIQFYFDKHPVFSLDHYARIHIYNDYNFDNPNIQSFDAFVVNGYRLYSPGIPTPLSATLELHLRDTDSSIYENTALPAEAPQLNELELTSAVISNALQTDIISITRINNGDLNGDGFVGIDDLNILLTHWNQSVTLGDRLSGDSSNDGFVGIDDLNEVLGNWNAGTPPNTSANIPEPATLILFTLGVIKTGHRQSR